MRRLSLFFRAAGLAVLPFTFAPVSAFGQTGTPANMDWPFYGNDPGGMRYVNVDQITPSNVTNLAPAGMTFTMLRGVAPFIGGIAETRLILERLQQLAKGANRAMVAVPEIAKAAEMLTALAARFSILPLGDALS